MKKVLCVLSLIILFMQLSQAQRFSDEIAAFKKADSIAYPFPNQHAIVFAGSSSFRKWETIQADFPGYPIINRGFGGSTFPDVIRFADEVIIKYAPKQVLIYCGDNDLASSDSITPQIVLERFKTLFSKIRHHLPKTAIAFVSIKPSPSRVKLLPKMIESNDLIKKFLKHKRKSAYIDVFSAMLNPDGSIRKELFVEDDLHMNATGYAIWQKIIEPYLTK